MLYRTYVLTVIAIRMVICFQCLSLELKQFGISDSEALLGREAQGTVA